MVPASWEQPLFSTIVLCWTPVQLKSIVNRSSTMWFALTSFCCCSFRICSQRWTYICKMMKSWYWYKWEIDCLILFVKVILPALIRITNNTNVILKPIWNCLLMFVAMVQVTDYLYKSRTKMSWQISIFRPVFWSRGGCRHSGTLFWKNGQ